jgi:hypothetical protein
MRKTARVHFNHVGKRVLVGVVGLFLGSAAWAGSIVGSAHDFSSQNWSLGQICVTCHTPHGGNTTVTDAPLWNHTVTTATYTLYSSGTLNAGPLAQPSGVSKLCLSCHDGTLAIDSFGGGAGTAGPLTGSKAVGAASEGSLANDHPIGFTFDTALSTADGALFDPATKAVTIGSGGTKTKSGTIATMMLFNGKLECASCHDVHNNFTAADGVGVGDPLLRVAKSGSAICLTCHNK